MASGEIFFTVVSLALSALYAQKKHYEFTLSRIEIKNGLQLHEDMKSKLAEIDEYKKKVDALSMKTAFSKF